MNAEVTQPHSELPPQARRKPKGILKGRTPGSASLWSNGWEVEGSPTQRAGSSPTCPQRLLPELLLLPQGLDPGLTLPQSPVSPLPGASSSAICLTLRLWPLGPCPQLYPRRQVPSVHSHRSESLKHLGLGLSLCLCPPAMPSSTVSHRCLP